MRLETDRLLLRSFRAAELVSSLDYLHDPEVMRFMPDGPVLREDIDRFLEEQSGPQADLLAAEQLYTGGLVGHMVFHPWFAPRTYEIGWVIAPQFQDHGYATEAGKRLLGHAFNDLGAHRVIATCQPENTASWRVMEKLQMRREGHFLQCISRPDGTFWDEYFYAILASEWEQQQQQ